MVFSPLSVRTIYNEDLSLIQIAYTAINFVTIYFLWVKDEHRGEWNIRNHKCWVNNIYNLYFKLEHKPIFPLCTVKFSSCLPAYSPTVLWIYVYLTAKMYNLHSQSCPTLLPVTFVLCKRKVSAAKIWWLFVFFNALNYLNKWTLRYTYLGSHYRHCEIRGTLSAFILDVML
jgi:hypothetical protein